MASFGDHPPLPEILEELLLDDSVSTVFLKAECKPRVKSGHISSLSLNELERELWDKPSLENLSDDLSLIIEQNSARSDCFIEIEREGCKVMQIGDLRVSCAWPPFSDAWEITVVRPVANLQLSDYKLDQELINRISNHHRGIFVVGKPGSGKTTLIKILQGIYKPTKGKVKIGERVNVKYFDQNKELIKLDSTPWKTLIDDGDHVEFLGKKIHVLSYLKKFLFDENKSLQNNSTLSGGEKVRLLLAKLFLNNHNFLILDEPTNDLDFETLKLLKENISNYDGTVLVISHDRYFLDHTVNKLLVFENDNQIFQHEGNFTEYFKKYGLSKLIKSNTKNINSNKILIKTHIKPIKILKKKLTFKENYNLKALPDKIEKLEIKLKKLETILDNNELYYNDKITFDKTLVEITNIKKEISLAEDELLDLQILQDEINKI